MRAVAAAIGAVLVFALAATGCDWRTFDDLKKNTPVASIGAPSGYAANDDFGPVLLPLAVPSDGSAAGRFVATATHTTSVGVISFDAAGQSSGVGVTGPALDLLQQGPVTAIAAIPGGDQLVLGAPATTLGDVLLMKQAPPHATQKFLDTVGEPQYGVGVGAGNFGGTSMPEIIVLSARTLHVYLDGLPTVDKQYVSTGAADPCPIDFSGSLPEVDRVNRAVIVAPLPSALQIAVGTPAVTGVGHVSVFDFDATTGVISCAATLTGTEAHFGRAMALVDLVPDANHAPDHLAVGAPPSHVYLYSLPLTTGAAPVATVTDATGGGVLFGAAVAAFDVDGVPGDEVLVGNADATVGGATTAGRVSIYTGATLTPLPAAFPNPLAEHDPGAGHGYGSAIAGMTFCPGMVASASPDGGVGGAGDGGVAACKTLPLVGSLSRVFAYFTLKTPDPRVK